MSEIQSVIHELSQKYMVHHDHQGVTLTFSEFMDLFQAAPERFIRDSSTYLRDLFDSFGTRNASETSLSKVRYKLFDLGTERGDPIIGGEDVQKDIYNNLTSFTRIGASSKLLVLHGPNGSSKSSTVDAISHAMQKYSRTPEGAVYKFNWIFPTDKDATPSAAGESGPIGFGGNATATLSSQTSYARLEDIKIASRITSEYKENPLFLIPMPYREELLRNALGKAQGIDPGDVELPPHILRNGLSKKNQQIFETLLNAYKGDIEKVLRHAQIERFYFSKQYRVGISTVEPQMRIDAGEKQLTLDKNIANIPSILQTISFFEAQGELIEANRGILEFSDLLKRPVEAFKYLLTTIERGSINLPSSSPNLDITYIATTNEKHLDAFKQLPDFSSFKGRMELITVPYLLEINEEQKIYRKDVDSLLKSIDIAPHTISTLCTWAVMTRLKQPDTEFYPKEYRVLVSKIDPLTKAKLYDGQDISAQYKGDQLKFLLSNRQKLMTESRGLMIYEGRFGASPREVRDILHKTAQSCSDNMMTVLDIFEELRKLIKDKTVYEFLQFEPRAGYHDAAGYITVLEKEYAKIFENELLDSMSMVEDTEYDKLLKRYIDHAVAYSKKEKILDSSTGSYVAYSDTILNDIEKILEIKTQKEENRKALLSRIAAWKIDNPDKELNVSEVFADLMQKIKNHFFKEREKTVKDICQTMLKVGMDDVKDIKEEELKLAEETYQKLKTKYQYDRKTALRTLKFIMKKT